MWLIVQDNDTRQKVRKNLPRASIARVQLLSRIPKQQMHKYNKWENIKQQILVMQH